MSVDTEISTLQQSLDEASLAKLLALPQVGVRTFVAEAVRLCRPAKVWVCDDSPEDAAAIRQLALAQGEETALATPGHTVHFDGYQDQARDKANTKYLVPPEMDLGSSLLATDRDQGLAEVRGLLDGAMADRTMIVRIYSLGPTGSEFAIPCVQITDSAYVAHSEDLLYRRGYEDLKSRPADAPFFRFLHSAGCLEGAVCRDVDKRRVFIDLTAEQVYSVNTQYAGNTVGLKKLAHRLAIRKAAREGWLAEHMLVMAMHGPGDRRTYFAGAFPSACGKTSTAMLAGQTIVGDDLAYLRKVAGQVRTCNVEAGIFGIIQDVSVANDPVIWDVLTRPGEVIFSNVLVHDGQPFWLGDGRTTPSAGINHSGAWSPDKTDAAGKPIPAAHKNARYTLRIAELSNRDDSADAPEGVLLQAVVYGGRDSDATPPVEQSFDWEHGVVLKGGGLESETTAATLGAEGVRKFNLMSNLDFLSMPVGAYLRMHLDFARDLERPPIILGVNYFLKDENGRYLNSIGDKRAWLQWAELRVHGEVRARQTPCGLIPLYEDLVPVFREHLGREYPLAEYHEEFALRVPQRLAKLERLEAIYRAETSELPPEVFAQLGAERERILAAQAAHGGDRIAPELFPIVD